MAQKINWKPFQALYDMGLLDNEVAEEMGVSDCSVSKHRRKLGLPSNYDNVELRKAALLRRKPKKITTPWKSLAEVAREAKERGMSYGAYVTAQKEGRL